MLRTLALLELGAGSLGKGYVSGDVMRMRWE